MLHHRTRFPDLRRALLMLPVLAVACGAAGPADDPVAIPEPSAEAIAYYRSGCALWVINQVWDLAVPAALLVFGASTWLRDRAGAIGRGKRVATVAVYATLYVILTALIDLPLSLYQGFFRQHAYGLSNQSIMRWFDHWAKGIGVSVVVTLIVGVAAYAVIARSPKRWWLYLGMLSLPFVVLGTFVVPLVVDPLFNDFGPMKDRALEARILALADRAGIADGRVFEVDKSKDTETVNAYVTGLLGSKRIVLWDTLLKKLDAEQVLFVMGHEMGHYVLGHVVQGLGVTVGLLLIGLFLTRLLAESALRRWGGRLGISSLADVASAPLLLICFELVALVLMPIGFAFSRHLEHEADRFALELTHSNRAGALAFVTLQKENLGMPRPDPLSVIWRSTHPSLADRVTFCNEYHPWREGQPERYAPRFRPEPAAEVPPVQAGTETRE